MRLSDRVRHGCPWLLLLAAVVATAAVYWPGVTGGWVFDDYPNIVDNAAIHLAWGHTTLASWVNVALSSPSSFLHRPLASITFALNWMMGNGNPYPFKFTNIVIHLVNGVLVFCMLRALLRLMALRGSSAAPAHRLLPPLVIPGLPEGQNPESTATQEKLDSGFRPAAGPGMTRQGARANAGPGMTRQDARANAGAGVTRHGVEANADARVTRQGVEANAGPAMTRQDARANAGAGVTRHGVEANADARVTRHGVEANAGPGMTSEVAEANAGPGTMTWASAATGFPRIDEAAATRLALFVAAAWMLLPINLMAVLYVVQRMESLCQVFVLAGLWAYLHGRWIMLTAGDARRERRGFALAVTGIVLGTLLGLTSKETAVLLPVFAFLAEWVVLGFAKPNRSKGRIPGSAFGGAETGPGMAEGKRGGVEANHAMATATSGHSGAARSAEPGIHVARVDVRILWTFTVTLFIPAVLGFLWLLRGALNPAAWSGRDFTLAQRLMTEARVLVDYLQWTLLPNPMVLSLYHDEIVKSTGLLAPWTTLGSIILLAALVVVGVLLRNRRPLVALGIGWFFAAQLLTATIIPLELVYEQRMYFASIGVLLAVGALLLGLRRRIAWALPRVFLVFALLAWFGTATCLRAIEWSDPIQLAVVEADRHPESPRAVYEAGRLLLIASHYQPGEVLDQSRKYLEEAAAIPGSSALADQALIMIVDHNHHGDDAAYWDSMTRKLRGQPTRQEDISALISLTNCYSAGICRFDTADLQRAYQAALSRPHPIARLLAAYAIFQRDLLHDDTQAEKYFALAVEGAPSEPAYRIDLASLYARSGQTEKARQQVAALRQMNIGGRLDGQIATLERQAEQGDATAPAATSAR